ncbi:histidine-tRNA ligase [Dictyostelium purpureum]|uniref:histidine--tRNA ligase n=1 Tax=Dictyostelium purpureum TaxID=5786 RepID=F0ZBH2_DICPU|nr:histidine-tRNA ligase [Dictyostelium purpureum]EGC38693.1 histidine-tRNA ligase [Dictyostelium purpureum]|eukprot:XP_003284789.1 histidine-tRNA ligase [Dictyostelium purpureum]
MSSSNLEQVTKEVEKMEVNPAAVEKKEKAPKEKKNNPRALKTPKGTQDYNPSQMTIREQVFDTIKQVFKRHGAVTIETPVFELKDTLTGKYGEDSKLIYDLADQGGEICSLRYDLTVPFARYVAMNRVQNIKRYHIARVYRRDNPVMTKGRFREFYQCDFDIAGEYDVMVPDAECLRIICEILDQVKVGKYVIKLNHRKLLDAIFAICGVPADKFRTICSAVDKLDKSPWDEVRKEMVEVKGLDGAIADKIEEFVKLSGPPFELLEKLRTSGMCDSNKDAVDALAQLETLFGYLEALGCTERILFDLSLARGLDYYTGIIYEAVLTQQDRVGSIAAGGRYDGLVGMYGKKDVPAVGFSIGIERIFTILEEEYTKNKLKIRENQTQVYVVQMDKELLKDRLKICSELWNAGINAEFAYKVNPKVAPQLNSANESLTPLTILIGKTEIETNTLSVKNMKDSKQISIPRENFTEKIKELLNNLN